jgi:hypothetical protein
MVSYVTSILAFIIALVISTIIISVVTKIFGEKEGIGTAVLAALIGTAIYTVGYHLLGQGWIAAFIAGIVWLLVLQFLYKIGWLKSFVIAFLIWIAATIAGWFLPTLTGPV